MKFSGLTLQNYRLCNNHFSERCYANSKDLRLVRNAVPNRFIEIECTGGESSIENVAPVIPDSWVENVPLTTSDMTDKCQPGTSNQPPVTPTRKLFRSVEGLSNIENSPRKLKLIRIINRKENQLRKVKRLCKKRGNDIKALANLSDSAVVHGLFQDMPSLTSNFLLAQIRCSKSKGSKGRRWTFDDKIMALAIYKKSPKCYRMLQKFVWLLSKKTLLSMLGKVPFHVGINEHLFSHINESIEGSADRCCVLLFDEMDIQENIEYDLGSDNILGFEYFGERTSSKPANKALLFMLVGLAKKWKQPVAYFFASNGCNANNFEHCLFQVLKAANNIAKVEVVVENSFLAKDAWCNP
ncbi:uncharacterized protein LOC109543340 [Dendroctonus ponderosae]|uniref:uncharacterized protein LOC109543340 n=1 Tax=Dendroctonus ponderosae TaxID=77166 RepID=UPI0020355384|nr:uncharacterized protein LOC109543340 [Dendroctonus ponderosae]